MSLMESSLYPEILVIFMRFWLSFWFIFILASISSVLGSSVSDPELSDSGLILRLWAFVSGVCLLSVLLPVFSSDSGSLLLVCFFLPDFVSFIL